MKEEFTFGWSCNPQYVDFVNYAKSRVGELAASFNKVLAGKEENVPHHKDWHEDECEEVVMLSEQFPEYNGRYSGFLFLHLFEEYAVYHSEISNEEKNEIFKAIYKIAFLEGYETSRLTDEWMLERHMSFNAYVMYRGLEKYALDAFYTVVTEKTVVYSYMRPSQM